MEARVCAYCKGNILTPITNESYKCKKCGSINYDVDKEINIKLANAQTELSTYNFTRADDIYKNILDNTTNPKVKAMALKGRICAHLGIVYVKGFYDGEVVATFANYDEHKVSIKSTPYYRDLLECEISEQDKQAYIDELNELDEDYQKIKEELDKTPEYDVFICTKISTKTKDTPDAKGVADDYNDIAQVFYEELTDKGFKVFLSKKTLKGIKYDGQIFSALMRSKVILVIATCKEYLESCWVESEWRRWLNFIDVGKRSRDTLFLYLSDENISLPSVLLSKKIQKFYGYQQIELLGKIYDFINPIKNEKDASLDEIKNIKDMLKNINHVNNNKINDIEYMNGMKLQLNDDGVSYSVIKYKDNPTKVIIDKYNIDPLLRKMFSYLKNGDWNAASQSIKKVLDTDPECSMGYLGKLMYELKLTDVEMLCEARIPQLTTRESFNLACKYASIDELKKLKEYEYNNAYSHGLYLMKNAKNEKDLEAASAWFELYPSFKDCKKKRKACLRKAKRIIKEKRKLERETEKKRKACLRQPKHIIKARKKLESKLDKIRKGISENVAFLFISILIVIIVAVDCYACHVLIKYCSATWGKWLLWPVLISLVPSVLTSYLVSRFNFKEWQFTTIKWIKIIGGCMRGSIIATSFTYWWGNVQSAIVRLLLILIICLINCICYIISAGVDEIIYENHYS